jgi:hypothetical protein
MIDYNDIINKITTGKVEKRENFSKDYVKTDIIGNTIIGRFLPDMKTMVKTNDFTSKPFTYHHHGWKSKLDGNGLFFMCANNYGEKCPDCNQSIKMWRSEDPLVKKASEEIRKRTNHVVNFYVISNPAKPEDNGKVKLLRFGKQIHDKYVMATEGDDKQYYGDKIWRLDETGCSFRIKCEATAGNANSSSGAKKKGDVYPTYNNSGFLPAGAVEGMTADKVKAIYDSTWELPALFKRHTVKELQAELEKHFLCNDTSIVQDVNTESKKVEVSAPTTPVVTQPTTPAVTVTPTVPATEGTTQQVVDDEIDAILKDLNT